MELRQLQHFVAVAEEQHFTRAARRVSIVQSALSTSIRMLEAELDVRLFVRSTRQVRLTGAGRVFLEKARLALDAVREARGAVAAIKGLERGTLSIGTVQSLPAFLDLPALLARFHALHPGIEVRLCQGSSTLLIDKIRAGRIDLAFLPIDEALDDVATTMIACDALVLACAPGHKLAGRTNIALNDLRDEAFVDFEPEWGTRKLVDRGFADVPFNRRIAFEVNDLDTMLELVGRGLGIALVPETIAEAHRPAIGIAGLGGPELCWELVVARMPRERGMPGPPDGAAGAFLELLGDGSRYLLDRLEFAG